MAETFPEAKLPEMVMRVALTLTEAQAAEFNRQREAYGACMVLITREGKFQIIERPDQLLAFDGGSQLANGGLILP